MAALKPDEFKVLKSTCVSSYFPISKATEESIEELTFSDEVIKRFKNDFDRLLKHRRELQGLTKAKAFQKWWDSNCGAYLTKPVVENYKQRDLNLGELLDDLHLHYLAIEERRKNEKWTTKALAPILKSQTLLTASLCVAMVIGKAGAFVWNLMILGPGVQMINSYTTPVITPLAQTATQTGSKDLAPVAAAIQGWLTNRDKLKVVNERIRVTTEKFRKVDFRKLTPEQTRAKWAEFEQTYFQLFMSYNQTLPSHLRDGRGFYRDWMLFTPVGLATNLAAFDTQYWMHRKALESLKPGEKSLKIIHKKQMAAAESRIAGTLAAWKVFEFMYPELTKESVSFKDKSGLRNTFKTLISSMSFDVYAEQFADQMESVLKQIDADFLMQDQIAKSAASNANSAVSPNTHASSAILKLRSR